MGICQLYDNVPIAIFVKRPQELPRKPPVHTSLTLLSQEFILKIKNTSRPRPNHTYWTKPIQIKWNCKLDIGLGNYCPVSLLPSLRPSIYNQERVMAVLIIN